MASILPMLLSLVVLQAFSKAAPNDNNVVISKYTEEDPKFDSLPTGVPDQSSNENESENNQRQKRFYDYIGFGYSLPEFPTNFPYPIQSHHSKRDESKYTGVYGAEDAFSQIFRRLQDILSDARRNAQPVPQQASIPAFIPFLYIPQAGCGCTTNNDVPPRRVNGNNQPQSNMDTTTPDLPNRFLEIDDTRQNWGIVVNNTNSNVDVEGDGNRPISFDPIIPETPIDIPVPPVEHGSVQAGAQPQPIPTTTFRPTTNRPISNIAPQGSRKIPAIAPSICDTAVISCCLRSQVTLNCFAQQGCPDPSLYGKPCDPEVVLNVVNKVQHYIKQRNG